MIKKYIVMLLILCFSIVMSACGRGDNKEMQELYALHESEERSLLVKYMYDNCGYGTITDFYSIVIEVYNDATVEVYGIFSEVSQEELCRETFHIEKSALEAITTHISESHVDEKESVESDSMACDGTSSEIYFYDSEGKEYNQLGGYMIIDEDFGKLERLIGEAVTKENIEQVRENVAKRVEEIYYEE